ncbi:OLC1v1015695C1 [Oldenlandia corymbosa var. corymbosa]|uniref:OLC1v1015695C1 n=1 Tax=Oldenlandia corymbosa var. corymbosa TaxID=529605 RepID=A0AAV1E3V5_OLDCO|nr:OLC1v1015695C1 [Oldenlandia corymbosa var. corymbosa]
MGSLKIEIITKKLIKPSKPTPKHLHKLSLSLFDQVAPKVYVDIIFYYSGDTNQTYNITAQRCERLEKSLADALVYFYQLAGRYVRDEVAMDCSDQGAEFWLARVSCKLSDFLPICYQEIEAVEELLPWGIHPPAVDLPSSPQLAIQVNRFDDGGIVLAVRISHIIADATTGSLLMRKWAAASAARSDLDDHNGSSNGFHHEIAGVFPATPSFELKHPRIIARSSCADGSSDHDKIVTRRFLIPLELVMKIKGEAAASYAPAKLPSRVVIALAIVWKSLMAMSVAKNGYMKGSTLSIATSLRLKTPLVGEKNKKLVFGNFYLSTIVPFVGDNNNEDVKLYDLIRLLSSKIADTHAKVAIASKDELATMLINSRKGILMDGLDNKKEVRSTHDLGLDVYYCSSWFGALPVYEIDFGWGKPIWASVSRQPGPGVCLMDSADGSVVELWVSLKNIEMINHPVTLPANVQGSLPPVTIANLGSYNSKGEWKPLPKIPQVMSLGNAGSGLYGDSNPFNVVNSDDDTSTTKLEAEKIKKKKKKRAVARESEKGPTANKSKTHTSPDKEIEATKQTEVTIPPSSEKEAPSEKESGPSARPSCVEKGKSPVAGNVTILPLEIPAGGPTVAVHTFDNPPTIECPMLEEFAACLTEADRLKLMCAVMMNHAKRSRDLRRELAEAQAKSDQAVIEKRALEERNQQLQAKEVKLASVQTQLGELKQKFQEYCDLHISKEDLNKWCTAFWWRMLSSGGMTAVVEEINTVSMAYGGHAENPKKTMYEALVRGLCKLSTDLLPLWEPLCEALSKMDLPENIASFPGDVAPVFSRGPCEELAIPKVSDEDFGINLKEDKDETAEEDDTSNSGAKDQDPPMVGDTGGPEEGNPTNEGSSEDQPGNDSRSQTARRERITVSPWFLEKFHILSLVEKQIHIRTERFIVAIEMLKKRSKEAEIYSRQSAVLQNILVDREIPLPVLEGLDEHEKAHERTAAKEFLLRLDEQDWEIVDLKDKLNQFIDHLRTLGFLGVIKPSQFNPKGEDLNIEG